jgi:hypothetical protein
MPYIPNLIPPEHQVLPEYFNGKNPINQQGQKPPSPFWYFAAAILTTAGIFNAERPWMAASLILTATLCTPYGKRKLESAAHFQLTLKLRLWFCLILLLLNIPLVFYYQHEGFLATQRQATLQQQARQFSADSAKKEQLRRDSLYQQISQSRHQTLKTAWVTLVNADRLAKTPEDKDTLTKTWHLLALSLSSQLINEGRYNQAQLILADQFKREPGSPSLLYNRALCYYRSGNIRLAVNDLDSARSSGFKEANRLYNKLNPLKKHVAYYCTLCCDGSTSDATGRGACSWHGGVCQWNHPIYETSRKYPSSHDSL